MKKGDGKADILILTATLLIQKLRQFFILFFVIFFRKYYVSFVEKCNTTYMKTNLPNLPYSAHMTKT